MEKYVAIVTHKYLPQPDDDLVLFLNRKSGYKIFHIKHYFPDSDNRRSVLSVHSKDQKTKQIKSPDFMGLPEIFLYIKETFFTFKWLMTSGKKFDLYIGMDGLSAFWGIVLKKLRLCKKVTYWSIDFVPVGRFNFGLKNHFYHKINKFACKNSDEVWDLSPRMASGREKYLGIRKSDYKCHKVVPYGLWIDRIKKVPYLKSEKNTLLFMGHLLPKQGVDTVLVNIKEIVKKNPKFKFKIIGGGSFKNDLVKLAKKLGVNKYCEFTGRIDSSFAMEKEIAKAAATVAPYKKTADNYSYYADPGKVKTYLACGVPVLLTNVPWNANEIEKNKCGIIIKGDGSDLVNKLSYIMKPEINQKYRDSAAKYSKKFDYEEIFGSLVF